MWLCVCVAPNPQGVAPSRCLPRNPPGVTKHGRGWNQPFLAPTCLYAGLVCTRTYLQQLAGLGVRHREELPAAEHHQHLWVSCYIVGKRSIPSIGVSYEGGGVRVPYLPLTKQ